MNIDKLLENEHNSIGLFLDSMSDGHGLSSGTFWGIGETKGTSVSLVLRVWL